jgi:hypothetical protein
LGDLDLAEYCFVSLDNALEKMPLLVAALPDRTFPAECKLFNPRTFTFEMG